MLSSSDAFAFGKMSDHSNIFVLSEALHHVSTLSRRRSRLQVAASLCKVFEKKRKENSNEQIMNQAST